MECLERLNNFLNKILMILGGVAVLSLMGLATGNVLLRMIFQMPYQGTYEIVSFLGAITIAFALGYAQKRKDHLALDILTSKFPKRINKILDGINYFVTMILFGIASWQVYMFALRIWKSSEVSETLKIPYYPLIISVSAGFAVFSFTLIIDFIKTLQNKP